MKKLCILLSILLVFTAGCGKKKPEEPAASPAIESASPSPEITPEVFSSGQPEPASSPDTPAETSEKERPSVSVPQNNQAAAPTQNTQNQPAAEQAQPEQQQAPAQQPAEQPKAQTVSLTISVPSEGRTILNQFPVEFEDGDTTFSILKKATRQQGIQMSFTGGNSNPYVEGIDNLYEFDQGAGSGWMCSKNGVFISKSAGKVPVSAGDSVLWVFTLDMGKDIGANVG